MGRLAKIIEGKSRHVLSQEVDFINKSLTKVNKSKLKEGHYVSIDDELNAIENGERDMFDNSDLEDPIMTNCIRSDLDYANHEDSLDGIEDDFAYEIERNGTVNYTETPFRGFRDNFDEMKAVLDVDGEVLGSYGHTVTETDDLVFEVLEIEIDEICEEWGIRLPSTSNYPYNVIESALNRLAPYANDTYPNCKGFFETLVNISQEYNATVTELNLNWPPLVRIPDQAGVLEENSVSNSLPASADSFLQDIAQMFGGINYADIIHFAKKATDAEVERIQALRRKFKAKFDDEEVAVGIAGQVVSFVKAVLTESKRKPSKKALKEHYGVSTTEGLAKYARDLASSVLDGKLHDSNAVLAICATLHCNEDYAEECLDSWIKTEQIRRRGKKK